MKKIVSFLFVISLLVFSLIAEPEYIEVEPDVFRWVELENVCEYDDHGNSVLYQSKNYVVKTSYKYDSDGNIIEESDDLNPEKITKYEYKDALLIKTIYYDGAYTVYTYDQNNNPIVEEYVDPNEPELNEKLYYEYDKNNNIVHSINTTKDYQIWYEYDKNNNLIKSKGSYEKYPTKYTYDNLNRPLKVDSEDDILSYEYNDEQHTEIFKIYDKEDDTESITLTKYDKNDNKIYERFIAPDIDLDTESWFMNEYHEDGKTLKKQTEYKTAF